MIIIVGVAIVAIVAIRTASHVLDCRLGLYRLHVVCCVVYVIVIIKALYYAVYVK